MIKFCTRNARKWSKQTNQDDETIDDSFIMNNNRADGTEKSQQANERTSTSIDLRKIYAHGPSEKQLHGHGRLTHDEQTKWTIQTKWTTHKFIVI